MGFGFASAAFAFIPFWFGFGIVITGIASLAFYADLDSKQEQQRNELAKNEYRQLPLDLLKKATTSQELNEPTKKIVTSLLNEEFEGWSFQ
jgi:hypothetical protein